MDKPQFVGKWRAYGCVNTMPHINAIHCNPEFNGKIEKLIATLGKDPDAITGEIIMDEKAETFQFTVVYKNVLNYDSGVLQFGKPVKQDAFIHGRPVEVVMFKKSENVLLMYRKSDDYWLDMTFTVEEDLLVLEMTGNGVTSKEYYRRM